MYLRMLDFSRTIGSALKWTEAFLLLCIAYSCISSLVTGVEYDSLQLIIIGGFVLIAHLFVCTLYMFLVIIMSILRSMFLEKQIAAGMDLQDLKSLFICIRAYIIAITVTMLLM